MNDNNLAKDNIENLTKIVVAYEKAITCKKYYSQLNRALHELRQEMYKIGLNCIAVQSILSNPEIENYMKFEKDGDFFDIFKKKIEDKLVEVEESKKVGENG